MRHLSHLALASTLALGLLACHRTDPGGPIEPFPAPDFSGTDLNPTSPTFGQTRTLSAEQGKVVLLYFALFT
jgi:hypothetical protein